MHRLLVLGMHDTVGTAPTSFKGQEMGVHLGCGFTRRNNLTTLERVRCRHVVCHVVKVLSPDWRNKG